MQKYSQEFSVGVFVLIGLLCLGYLTIKLGKLEMFSGNGYNIQARFTSVAGLKVGAGIEIAGVSVGKVTKIALDQTTYTAEVTLQLPPEVVLSNDAIASIKTSGLIGDKYISISLGNGNPIPPGGQLTETESSVDIESLISKVIFGGAK